MNSRGKLLFLVSEMKKKGEKKKSKNLIIVHHDDIRTLELKINERSPETAPSNC